jgi:hypothetical protein
MAGHSATYLVARSAAPMAHCSTAETMVVQMVPLKAVVKAE